jgi:hypothetical protein
MGGVAMTFDEWFAATNEPEAYRDDMRETWDAALSESGTRELYEACKELRESLAAAMRVIAESDNIDSFLRGQQRSGVPDGIGLRSAAVIAHYESCVGAKP